MRLAFIFLAAYLLDLALGDPPNWPHPVRLLGRLSEYWEGVLYRPHVAAGALFWLAVLASAFAGVVVLMSVAGFLPRVAGVALLVYLLYAGLATRSLHQESRRVEEALARGDLPEARARLAMIVGRETAHLEPEEIRRAVLETVAENLNDGVAAPMFYTLLLGLPGLVLYKAANTMDSMVGYKNLRYARFGKCAARADDLLNLIPARLTGYLMVPAARLAGLDHRGAWRILCRDAGQSSSPNAGWPEAAMAGALSVRLGGPSTYFGHLVDKPFIGDPNQPLTAETYDQAIRLLYATSILMAALTFGVLVASRVGMWGLLSLVR